MIDNPTWLEQDWRGGINYTGRLRRLMHDIVERVPALSFIDMSRVLVFARPGRSSADGPYASCHSLRLPTSDPGYFFWRDRNTGEMTRRSEWFVTKSPDVYVDGRLMNYMISFALPRFTDQALSRSRKRVLYPEGTPDWVAKLDTVVHELYHIDPEENCLRRFTDADGEVLDVLHSQTYFADVAGFVRHYLATNPNPEILEFLHDDFEGLRARFGGVGAATFRAFPSYPRRYREVVADQPLPLDLQSTPVERLIDPIPGKAFSDDDLQLREFRGQTSRVIANYTRAAAA